VIAVPDNRSYEALADTHLDAAGFHSRRLAGIDSKLDFGTVDDERTTLTDSAGRSAAR
jgi:hypothetical protein